MKLLPLIIALLGLSACDSTTSEEKIVFADGSEFVKKQFEDGMRKGCDTKSVETVAHFDRKKYCDCMIDYVMKNAGSINLESASDKAEESGVNLVSYFDSDNGAAQVTTCREAAVDESKIDWAAEEVLFKESFPVTDTTIAGIEKHKTYLDCVWTQVKEQCTARELMNPQFKESEKLKGIVQTCKR